MDLFRKLRENEIVSNKNILELIENRYNFFFPRRFKLFHAKLKVGQYSENWASYIDSDLRIKPLYKVMFETPKMSLNYGWLFSPKEIELDMRYYDEAEELLQENGIVRIGNIIVGGGLYLGITENNKDFIFKMSWDTDDEPIKISESIFEFITSLKIICSRNIRNLRKSVTDKFYVEEENKFSIDSKYINEIKEIEDIRLIYEDLEDEKLFMEDVKKIINYVRDKNNKNS